MGLLYPKSMMQWIKKKKKEKEVQRKYNQKYYAAKIQEYTKSENDISNNSLERPMALKRKLCSQSTRYNFSKSDRPSIASDLHNSFNLINSGNGDSEMNSGNDDSKRFHSYQQNENHALAISWTKKKKVVQ
ncbi:hypothetical protein Leryth_024584 [Lithospermum erythrorhizon]|nr:hypothetical protein Leryth_024584 [Lithospermum erythrorhizon]